MSSEKEYTQEELDALGNKVNRMIGFAILIIAAIIISINLYCRFSDDSKAKDYEYTDGSVIKKEEYKTYPFGGYGRPNYDYEIKVEYLPKGEDHTYIFWDYAHAYENIELGDILRIYYKEDDPEEAYAARKDWLTKKYLPAENHYNIPLVISLVLIVIGIYFFLDDSKKSENKKS